MKASQRRMVTAAVAILIVIVSGLVIRNCGAGNRETITVKSGQARDVGSINWSVVSVMKVRTIQPEGANLTAKGWFLIVDLYLTNNAKDKIQFDPNSLSLTDSSGQTYTPNKTATEAQIKAQANSEIGSVYNTALNPGKKQRLAVAFDITETATKLKLKIKGSGFNASQDLVIDLGF